MREYDIVGIIPPLRSDYLPINNNGNSTVKTYQMSSIRTTPEKFENGKSQIMMDLCLTKPRARKSRDDRDYISRKAPVSKCSHPNENQKPAFSNSSGLKSVS